MAVDYSYKLIEIFLMAKRYKSRDEVLAFAKFTVDVVCAVGNLAPVWVKAYKEAYKKLTSLSFSEMNEIIDILKSYDDDESPKKSPGDKNTADETADLGEREYDEGMKYYSEENYFAAAMCFKTAASKGCGKAEYNYALCLYNGQGIKPDKVEAVKRFVAAAESGVEQADKMLNYIIDSKG